MKTGTRHWIEPLQILEKIGKPEGLRAFVQDGLDCGFSRSEIAELYGTYFEDRLAEALGLGLAAGVYQPGSEFSRRIADVLAMPEQLFKKNAPGLKALPVDAAYLRCFREATFAVEGSFHRYVEGDYVPVVPVSSLLREAHTAMLAGNLARAFDRVTAAGARVLEGDYLARPTEWLETDPLYSWLLGIERLAHVVSHLDGWPGGRFEEWAAAPELSWRVEPSVHTEITQARREVLQLLKEEDFTAVALTRMRRNRRWVGPELLRLLRMPDDDTTPTVVRNAVRSLGAVGFRPAVDDLLGLLMRAGLDSDEEDEDIAKACQEALESFGPAIKEQLLHHFDLALVDTQRIAIARVLAKLENDNDVLEILEHLVEETRQFDHRIALFSLIASYKHRRVPGILKEQMRRAQAARQDEMREVLEKLARPRRNRKVAS